MVVNMLCFIAFAISIYTAYLMIYYISDILWYALIIPMAIAATVISYLHGYWAIMIYTSIITLFTIVLLIGLIFIRHDENIGRSYLNYNQTLNDVYRSIHLQTRSKHVNNEIRRGFSEWQQIPVVSKLELVRAKIHYNDMKWQLFYHDFLEKKRDRDVSRWARGVWNKIEEDRNYFWICPYKITPHENESGRGLGIMSNDYLLILQVYYSYLGSISRLKIQQSEDMSVYNGMCLIFMDDKFMIREIRFAQEEQYARKQPSNINRFFLYESHNYSESIEVPIDKIVVIGFVRRVERDYK